MHVFVCNGYIERRGTRYRPEFEHDHAAVDGFPECDCECGRTFSDAVHVSARALEAKIAWQAEEIRVADQLLEQRNRLLDMFECPVHGKGCIPHAIQEVERLRLVDAQESVRSGQWCLQNRAEGRGGCGACRWCCMQLESQLVDITYALMQKQFIPVARIRGFDPPRVEWMSYNLHELGHVLERGEQLYAKVSK